MIARFRRKEISQLAGELLWRGSAVPPRSRWLHYTLGIIFMGFLFAFVEPFIPSKIQPTSTMEEKLAAFPPSTGEIVFWIEAHLLIALSIFLVIYLATHVWIARGALVFGGLLPWFKVHALPMSSIDHNSLHVHYHRPRKLKEIQELPVIARLAGQLRWRDKSTLAVYSEAVIPIRNGRQTTISSLDAGWFYFGVEVEEVKAAIAEGLRSGETLRFIPNYSPGLERLLASASAKNAKAPRGRCAFCQYEALDPSVVTARR